VTPIRGEQHRNPGERREQQHRETALGDRSPDYFVHRPHRGEWQIAIERCQIGGARSGRRPWDGRRSGPAIVSEST